MKKEIKTLKAGESTFKNGGGAMCGGVVSKSLFNSNPMAFMMAYYMDDKHFEKYKVEKDKKKRHNLFEKYARSAI
jgi:hypothetical protein